MANSHVLPALMICLRVTVVYGDLCTEENLHTIFDYQEQPIGIVAFLKSINVITNFNTTQHCKSIETCTMYCEMSCRHHNCTVYAIQGNTCFVHNYNISGKWNMITVDKVWFRKGLNIEKGKSQFACIESLSS